MLLYSAIRSPRLSYILAFIEQQIVFQTIEITSDKILFHNYPGPKINYSYNQIELHEYRIHPAALLFEEGIRQQPIECFETADYKAFFRTAKGDFPFDIFAASFYLLTRYEEYLPHEKDEYNRYAHTNSLAFQEDVLQLPLVNIWFMDWKRSLVLKFPRLSFKSSAFRHIPTYDIDIAYSYTGKGLLRYFGGFCRSVVTADARSIIERTQVLLRKRKDPFDVYDWLDELHEVHRIEPLYFFLLANKWKGVDSNISPACKVMHDLVLRHAEKYRIGIHPSWQSGDKHSLVKNELKQLESMAEIKVGCSRQHYLRFSLPETYRILLDAGVRQEFSMGYGTTNGFRASVASPFYWYDLEKETATELMIFPFCFMDATARFRSKLIPTQALDSLNYYADVIRKVDGLMITIWHNHLFGTDESQAGWRAIYQHFLQSTAPVFSA